MMMDQNTIDFLTMVIGILKKNQKILWGLGISIIVLIVILGVIVVYWIVQTKGVIKLIKDFHQIFDLEKIRRYVQLSEETMKMEADKQYEEMQEQVKEEIKEIEIEKELLTEHRDTLRKQILQTRANMADIILILLKEIDHEYREHALTKLKNYEQSDLSLSSQMVLAYIFKTAINRFSGAFCLT